MWSNSQQNLDIGYHLLFLWQTSSVNCYPLYRLFQAHVRGADLCSLGVSCDDSATCSAMVVISWKNQTGYMPPQNPCCTPLCHPGGLGGGEICRIVQPMISHPVFGTSSKTHLRLGAGRQGREIQGRYSWRGLEKPSVVFTFSFCALGQLL